MSEKKRIAVIGAGIAGLTCAYNLQEQGYDVVVFEKETTVGGRMRSREKDGLWFDIGATHLIPLYTHMRKYIDAFDIEWHKMEFELYGLLRDHSINTIAKQISKRTSLNLALLYTKLGSELTETFNLNPAVEYDTDDAYSYLRDSVSQEAADYLGDGFTAAYQFHRSNEISKAAFMSVLQSVKREREEWFLHRTRRGMSALPEAFQERLKDVRVGTGVQSVSTTDSGVTITTEAGDVEKFDAVVVATTATVAEKMLSAPTAPQKTLLSSVEYASSVSYAFKIDEGVTPESGKPQGEHQYSIVWVPYVENTVFSGISNEVMKGDDLRSGGKTLICTWLHDGVAREMLAKNATDEELFEYGITEFVKMCPWITDRSQLEPHDLERWHEAMPKFKQGLITRVVDFYNAGAAGGGQGAGNVFLAGDYLNSPWTEGALQNGERTAVQVHEQLQK